MSSLTVAGIAGSRAYHAVPIAGQSAIFGVGAVRQGAAVLDGVGLARRPVSPRLTFDHRLVCGFPAAAFLGGLANLLGNRAHMEFGV